MPLGRPQDPVALRMPGTKERGVRVGYGRPSM